MKVACTVPAKSSISAEEICTVFHGRLQRVFPEDSFVRGAAGDADITLELTTLSGSNVVGRVVSPDRPDTRALGMAVADSRFGMEAIEGFLDTLIAQWRGE